MASLSDEFRYYHKDNHNFVKPLKGDNYGVILEWYAPYEAQTGYRITPEECTVIHPDVVLSTVTDTLEIDQYGHAYPEAGQAAADIFKTTPGMNSLPSYGNHRVMEFWGRCTNYTNLTLYDGLEVNFNDDNLGNRWMARHQDNGSNWDPYVAEYVATVWNLRLSPTDIAQSSSPVTHKWYMRIVEAQDYVVQQITLLPNAPTATSQWQETSSCLYEASRSNKDVHNCRARLFSGYTDKSIMAIRGFRISHP